MTVAESLLLANAVTKGAFNVDVQEFFTGKVDGRYRPGTDGGQVVTLPELLGAGPGGFGGNYGSNFPGGLPQVLKHNLQENGAQLIMSLIVIPIAFKVGSSLLKKPRRQANALLKQVGVTGVKV